MSKEILKAAREKMAQSLEAFHRELAGVRTGRASPALVEDIRVEYYGTQVPIKQVANITVPEPRLIIIHPWDKSVVGEVVKAIQKSDLGLTPVADGDILRIPVPSLSEERRDQLVKVVHKMAEEIRIELRNHRRDCRESLKAREKEGKISKDQNHDAQEEMQKVTNQHIEEVDKILAAKEKEITEI